MPLVPKTISCPVFGVLKGEGRSKVWEGSLTVPALGGQFFVRVHGVEGGPTHSQLALIDKTLRNADRIRAEATQPVVGFLLDAGVVPGGVELTPGNIWGQLTPCFLEVHPDDGAEPGTGALSLGYEMPWEHEHLLQVHVVDGLFSGVGSE